MAAANKVSLKLMIDTESCRVLYAEAGKEFVDFLLNILTLPIGTFIPLLNREMVGGLGNIYESIENLSTTYLQPNLNKDTLLKYEVHISGGTRVPLELPNVTTSTTSRKLYGCTSTRCNTVSHLNSLVRCWCGPYLYELTYRGPSRPKDPYFTNETESEGGYVEEAVTYMVMDDLAVKPFSTDSIITLLDKLNVKEIGTLLEKVVDLGVDEVVKLLKASLLTKSVLTDVFLPSLVQEVNCQENAAAK
ncbi:hypothetical protein ACB098_06G166500 [Castanea mollissima]|uniref:DUF674 domain-containing protein n=1 Tax=Castanea mollissima TaxID=60419 RepID=A0A8J4VQS0_9ROSI|nr:hypothetical protein CMV_006906 [Castanea mollissima]